MNPRTVRQAIAGPAGAIECAIDVPGGAPRGIAVLCHPHPQQGGTLDNKVVQTLARAFVQLGWRSVRFNFRGVGGSAGSWDAGVGEVDDAFAVLQAFRNDAAGAPQPYALGGFSFGGFVAAAVTERMGEDRPQRLVLVGPSTQKQQVPPVPADTVVIHGESDEIVPLGATLDWARPQALPVVVIPGVGHFFHGSLPLLKSVVLRELHELGPAA
ncbi:alpha/beta hydrolase [Piscinibacter koreensis]|uniref:Alpha/beta fold hydrolase n=1 Tax=Piscinibacter koreensis TaxID=2742824 RepID=A0A7Y6TVA2_9BURK|nr:alpha/beta fold hydrolase [Schlegelella koreensis]NUZ04879.1 alpha/beta fold hydrolase [Schlegelella koreensis]